MASSRIYVRGLPPNLSEADFRKHFGSKYTATDFQLKPQRRIGYVGFQSAEDAAKAAKYFHKSFIRMSRLHVELAQSPDEAPQARHSQRKKLAFASESQINSHQQNPLKRKRPTKDSLEHDVAQKPGDTTSRPPISDPATLDSQGEPQSLVPESHNLAKDSPKDLLPQDSNVDGQEEEVDATAQVQTPIAEDKGDDDWMRSRTTRLLGLQDDDDDLAKRVHPTDKAPALQDHDTLDEDGGTTGDVEPEHGQPDSPMPANEPIIKEVQPPGRRLFLRNLAYTVTEEQITAALAPFGTLTEVKLPRDFDSGKAKGFAFAQYESGDQASAATVALDGSIFQGRLLHIISATEKRQGQQDEFAISQLPLKKRKIIEKRQEAASSTFNWNALYMNPDAVISSAASRLGVSKSELLDPTSADAAVKQAQIETHSIQEAKRFFESHGVDLEAFGRSKRDGNALLVKNFKYDTSAEDLKKLFAQSGDVTRVLMPPGGTIAIVEFPNKVQAKTALGAFAYRKHRDSVLFLERAPQDLFKSKAADSSAPGVSGTGPVSAKAAGGDQTPPQDPADADEMETATLFVRNLNFTTTSERLQQVFSEACGPVRSARVVTKTDPKRAGETLSMGFGFVEFATKEQAKAAFLAMNGQVVEGHDLQIKASHKGLDAAAERRRDDRAQRKGQRKSRLIVKNLPFEASKKDVRNLFGSYGQVKAVRMPKKINNSSRGYAFVDFSTPQQAEKAMDLSRTHLLGRRLVIDYAEGDAEDPEAEIERMQEKVGRQSNRVALQKLTTGDRKKFIAGGDDEGMDEA